MDFLRRVFGLQPAQDQAVTDTQPNRTGLSQSPSAGSKNDGLDGATAPLTPGLEAAPIKDDAEDGNAEIEDTKIIEDGGTRKLPELDADMLREKGKRIVYGIHTDVGQIRTNNQDAVFSFLASSASSEDLPEFGIFIVADGMGGHHDGEKASAVTARIVTQYLINHIFSPMLNNNANESERPTISEVLKDAIQSANREVSKQVPEGGTTVTAAAVMGELAYIGHVGDSRAYILENGQIEHITRDHSLVQRLIELEQLTPEEALEHPQRNVLYRAIGQNDSIDVDAITRRLSPGAQLLICSDGLWNLIADDEIMNTVSASPTPQIACETLVKLANDRGGPDNISVILVKIPN